MLDVCLEYEARPRLDHDTRLSDPSRYTPRKWGMNVRAIESRNQPPFWNPQPGRHIARAPAVRPHVSLMNTRQSDQPVDFSALIEAIATRRDTSAFVALFDHFAPRVKTYLLRFRMTPSSAEEVAQETLLKVWRKAALFDPAQASAGTWIFAIARNQRIDALRRQRRDVMPDPSTEPDPPKQPDFAINSSELDQRVREALKVLPAEQARVIELSFFEEQPHAAIARTLGIPLGTVKSRARLALNRLRELLGDLT